jgi:hypothetical protein
MMQSRAVLSKIGFQGLSVHEGTWCTDGTGLGPLLSRDSNCSDGPCRSSDPPGADGAFKPSHASSEARPSRQGSMWPVKGRPPTRSRVDRRPSRIT